MDVSAANMNVGSTLISHMPLPDMPFQTHDTVIFQTPVYLDPAQTQGKKRITEQVQQAMELEKLLEKKKNNNLYTYHPINANITHRQGEVVDFIIA